MRVANPIEIKSAVRDILVSTLPDFTVTWSFAVRQPPHAWCYLGGFRWPEAEWATNRSRQYTVSLPIILNVLTLRKSSETVETELAANFNDIETAFNADSTLRDVGVISWSLEPVSLDSQPSADNGIEGQSVMELRVTYRP